MANSEYETPQSSPHRIHVSLAVTGYAACVFIWLASMAGIAILAANSPMAMPALMAVFAGGLVLIVLLVVVRLIGPRE